MSQIRPWYIRTVVFFVPWPQHFFGSCRLIYLYRKELFIILMLVMVVVGSVADLFHDLKEGAATAHLAIELVLIFVSFTLITVLAVGVWREQRDNRRLKQELAAHEVAAAGRQSPEFLEARHRLAQLAERQFHEWGFTATEREVALLLLKGLSFKEIAAVRDTVEKTVRQQASTLYRKSGLSGRHELAGWFIEDFL